MPNRRETGSYWEREAAAYLERCGYQILDYNFYAGHKEIDLVAREGGYLVFVEVKSARDERMGDPLEKVNAAKQRRIRQAAKRYLYQRGISLDTPCRFDVVRVLGEHFEVISDAF